MDVKNIKETAMKVKRLALVFLSITTITACNNESVISDGQTPVETGHNVSIKVHVPKGSVSTYAGED
ncbi:MAG: hypothetical protein LBD80_05955, partial [Tannerella sp.]|nr:hypothetical protein [Tannerella sp.]